MPCPMSGEKVWLKRSEYNVAEKNFYENKSKSITNCIVQPVTPQLISQPALTQEKVWLQKTRYDEAEKMFYEKLMKLSMTQALAEPIIPTVIHERVWLQKRVYAEAERHYYEKLAKLSKPEKALLEPVIPTISQDRVWLQKLQYLEAEKLYYEKLAQLQKGEQVCKTIHNNVKQNKKRNRNSISETVEQSSLTHQTSKHQIDATPVNVTNDEKSNEGCSNTVRLEEIKNILDSSPCEPVVTIETTTIQPLCRTVDVPLPEHEVVGILHQEPKEEIPVPLQQQQPALKKKKDPADKKSSVNKTLEVHTPPPSIISNTDEKHFKTKDSKRSKINKKERHRNSYKEDKGISTNLNCKNSLASEVAKARQHIKNSLECIDDIAVMAANNLSVDINNRLNTLEKEKSDLKKQVSDLTALVSKLELRLVKLESSCPTTTSSSTMTTNDQSAHSKTQQKPQKKVEEDEDDGVDLFGSDSEEEDAEAARIKEQRLAEYAAKKSKKPVLIAKSNIILDVKPWDDETNMKEMEQHVRKVTTDGLVWGASKLVPLAYGIHKLQISCVVEDDKVSVDWLQETIQEIEDYVQSVDIAAFNKV